MEEKLRKRLTYLLREVANRIDAGNCDLTETEALYIMEVMTRTSMSKESACSYLV